VEKTLQSLTLSRPLELAEAHNAIIISPTYRLIPEATGGDVMDDITDFWHWVHSGLSSALLAEKPNIDLDLARIAAVGESAGGFLTLQSTLLFPDAKIKAAIAQYPSQYPDVAAFDPPPAEVDAELNNVVSEYLRGIKPGAMRVSTPFPENLALVQAVLTTGRYREIFGDDERVTLGHALAVAKEISPMWIVQGSDDQSVSMNYTAGGRISADIVGFIDTETGN